MKSNQVIFVSHQYKTTSNTIYNHIQNGLLFKLTGADEIEFEFCAGGAFSLSFQNRGRIYGKFGSIIPNEEIVLEWNVNGFNREDESTQVKIILNENSEGVLLNVNHSGIKSSQSFTAKEQAWKEILTEFGSETENISSNFP